MNIDPVRGSGKAHNCKCTISQEMESETIEDFFEKDSNVLQLSVPQRLHGVDLAFRWVSKVSSAFCSLPRSNP